MSAMINTLLESQEKLLDIAQQTNNIHIVDHILETPFFYKGYGCIQVSCIESANEILSKYIDKSEWIRDYPQFFSNNMSLNNLSKTFIFSNHGFKGLLTDLLLSPDLHLINVAIFPCDID
jgi:hypothetical protein